MNIGIALRRRQYNNNIYGVRPMIEHDVATTRKYYESESANSKHCSL